MRDALGDRPCQQSDVRWAWMSCARVDSSARFTPLSQSEV